LSRGEKKKEPHEAGITNDHADLGKNEKKGEDVDTVEGAYLSATLTEGEEGKGGEEERYGRQPTSLSSPTTCSR